jgi:hypothetical protein
MIDETKNNLSYEEFKSFNTEMHKNAKPPREAYLYLPTLAETIDINEEDPSKSMRKIFDLPEDEFTIFERDCLQQFQVELDKYNQEAKPNDIINLPNDWKQCETLRFLHATHFKIPESIKLIQKHLSWRKSYFPITLTQNAIEILNSGFIYGFGRDSRYRPIFVVKTEIYLKMGKRYSYDDWLMAVVFFCEYIVNNMTIPGQLENWIIIADVSNTSILQIPTDVSRIFQTLQSNYRCRLIKVYIYGMSNVLNFLWNIIKNMLHPSTNKKIKFIKQDNLKELFESINPDQVEKKYGGNADSLEVNFFPPYMPNDNILLPGEIKQNILVTESMYKDLYVNGKLTTLSPYINETKSVYTIPHTQVSGRNISSFKNISKLY